MKSICILVSCIFLAVSCGVELDPEENIRLSPKLKLNLGSETYEINEFIEDLGSESVEVVSQNNTIIKFVSTDTILFDDLDQFLVLEGINKTETYQPFTSDINGTSPIALSQNVGSTFSFDANELSSSGQVIDSIYFKSGTLDYSMYYNFQADIDYNWEINGIQSVATNRNLSGEEVIPYGPVRDDYSTPLNGLKGVFCRDDNCTTRGFDIIFDGDLSIPANTPISSASSITFELGFNNIDFKQIFGNFGNDTVEGDPLEVDLSAFDEFDGAEFKFGDPSINLTFQNSFGIEMSLDLTQLKAVGKDNSEVFLSGEFAKEHYIEPALSPGDTKTTNININSTNSNIADLFTSSIAKIKMPVVVEYNPIEGTSAANFITENSRIEVISAVEIPMELVLKNFVKEFEFDLDEINFDELTINGFKLEIQTTNDIPVSGLMKIQLRDDDNGGEIRELNTTGSIEAPTSFDDNGRVSAAKESSIIVELNQEELDFLQNKAETIVISTTVNTSDADSDKQVKFYSDYEMKLEVKGEIDADIEVEL